MGLVVGLLVGVLAGVGLFLYFISVLEIINQLLPAEQ